MTSMNIALFVLSLLGFTALALAMPRHGKQLFNKNLPTLQRRLLSGVGWLLLAIALSLGIYQWQFDIGTVAWLGWLSVAGLVLVFCLPRWSSKEKTSRSKHKQFKQKSDDGKADSAALDVTTGRRPSSYAKIAVAALLIPLSIFSWQLVTTPQKALLRDDVVRGEIGPWSFALAEKEQQAPELVDMDIPLKQFVIRFCDGCETQIRMAYLKVRKPHSLRAAGNAFEGRGLEKTAAIALPAAATMEDGLWLTVEAKNGEVYQQQFDIQRLSPLSAQFIRERS